jgi:hypothetical protein
VSEILESVSRITEWNDLSEFMKDEDLDSALATVVKLIAKPDVPFAQAHTLIVRLQALSAKFGIQARVYTTFAVPGDKDAAKKKNVYYTMNEEIDKLVAALKYSAKSGV